ncbi:MAG: RNA polymerase sigma factor [Alphaproteobacteria bacterium]
MEDSELADLVPRARGGDRAAREALVRAFLRPAYAVALGVLRNPADAEDVAQESLMIALERLGQCREAESFPAWLLQSVRNRALAQATRSTNRLRLVGGLDAPGSHAELKAEPFARRRLLDALAVLGDAQREVVLLHDLEDWTHAEIASALGISEVMSRQHLFVARRALRKRLAETAPDESADRAARRPS